MYIHIYIKEKIMSLIVILIHFIYNWIIRDFVNFFKEPELYVNLFINY